ncbi:unnamed protein product [Pylaiella littoralis]
MMSRVALAIATGVGALHSTAGVSLRSNGAGAASGRKLQTLYCNSIGCPGGYIPIVDAQETVCSSDPCEVDECCEAFCAFYACPSGKTPIVNASTILCTDNECSETQCCEAYCSYHPCSGGLIPIEDASTTLCTDDVCTDDQCCTTVSVDNGGEITTPTTPDNTTTTIPTTPVDGTLYCNSIGCPGGYTPIADAQNTECSSDPCDVDQCRPDPHRGRLHHPVHRRRLHRRPVLHVGVTQTRAGHPARNTRHLGSPASSTNFLFV